MCQPNDKSATASPTAPKATAPGVVADAAATISAPKPPHKPRRRITISDATIIAEHVAKGLTETDAVALVLNCKPVVWFNWKRRKRNSLKCHDLFARTQAARQNNLIENIATVADIDRAKSAGVRHDWRAAQMLAGLHDDRFRAQRDASNVTTNNTLLVGGEPDKLRRLIDMFSQVACNELAGGQAQEQLPRPEPALPAPATPTPGDGPTDKTIDV